MNLLLTVLVTWSQTAYETLSLARRKIFYIEAIEQFAYYFHAPLWISAKHKLALRLHLELQEKTNKGPTMEQMEKFEERLDEVIDWLRRRWTVMLPILKERDPNLSWHDEY